MLYIRIILDYNDSSYQKEANKEYIINKDKREDEKWVNNLIKMDSD